MVKDHKPVAGSRAFWPRKRAKRIYPRFKHSEELSRLASNLPEVKPLEFAGYKAGMTQVFYIDNRKGSPTQGQEVARAATVIDCPPLFVFGVKLYERKESGLSELGVIYSDNLKKDLARKLSLPKKKTKTTESMEKLIEKACDVRLLVHTQPRESGLRKKKPEVFEIDLSGNDVKAKWEYAKQKLGKEIDVSEVFDTGEFIDVKAVTTGKGTQGPVKRFGVKIRSRKNKEKRRHIGSLGAVTPGRVLPGKIAMPGQLGFQTRTEYNKRILTIGSDGIQPKGGFVNYGIVPKRYVIIEGSVPSPKKRLVMFRKAFRKFDMKQPVEVKAVSLESQQ